MLKSVRFFLFLSFIIIAFIATKTFAATYSCPDIRQYISCNAGYYLNNTDVGNSCVLCPSGYTSAEGATSIDECYIEVPGSYHIAELGDSVPTICGTGEYKEAHKVYYGTNSSCNTCLNGFVDGEPVSANTDCKKLVPAGNWMGANYEIKHCSAGKYNEEHYVRAGMPGSSCQACPSGYTSAEEAKSINECYIDVPGAYHIANVYDSTPIICNTSEYKEAHRVYYGESSSCNRCLEGYTSEEAGTDSSSCKIYCAGGSYLANVNDTICSNVGIGYWAAESVVSQGEVGVRNPCSDGMTTIGFGTGADEMWDCGRILHIGDNKIYLRSKSKTTPSLNVRIDGTTYYGNMSTDIKGNLRIKSGTTTYSVYDDSM